MNSKERKCSGCIWYESCGVGDGAMSCEHYDPTDEDEYIEAEYEQDLKYRARVYENIIKDYN